MRRIPIFAFILLFSTSAVHSTFANDILKVQNLRTEYHENPSGLDVEKPRFSWTLDGDGRNRAQSAYQIVVHQPRKNWPHLTGMFGIVAK